MTVDGVNRKVHNTGYKARPYWASGKPPIPATHPPHSNFNITSGARGKKGETLRSSPRQMKHVQQQ